MDSTATDVTDLTAVAIAAEVQAGRISPVDILRRYLDQIDTLDGRIGAFQRVRHEQALAEAEALALRDDLHKLPLAGVPVAIKDNVDVAGEPTRLGSTATPWTARPTDHETVRRLRAAGAIIIGKTRVPELTVWATTDSVYGITRNPWDLSRTAGGSSGGSAAAVASAMAPLALASDGLGSTRIPAANCGLIGLKPGPGVIPADIGVSNWLGLAEHGPIATTVADAALMLAMLADRPVLQDPAPPERRLRIAISTKTPLPGTRVDRAFRQATAEIGDLLAAAGHDVEPADPPYTIPLALDVVAYWCAAVAEEADAVDTARLERRTQRHAALGRVLERLGRVRPQERVRWQQRLAPFFTTYDLLLTPSLAAPPIDVGPWRQRSWLRNVYANASYAPFAAAWNFAGYPAAVVPAGQLEQHLPLSVQFVGAPGAEPLLLSVARQIETLRPWPRYAPIAARSGGEQ